MQGKKMEVKEGLLTTFSDSRVVVVMIINKSVAECLFGLFAEYLTLYPTLLDEAFAVLYEKQFKHCFGIHAAYVKHVHKL